MSLKDEMLEITQSQEKKAKEFAARKKPNKKLAKEKEKKQKALEIQNKEKFRADIEKDIVPDAWKKMYETLVAQIKKNITDASFSVELNLDDKTRLDLESYNSYSYFTAWATNKLRKEDLKSVSVMVFDDITYYASDEDYENLRDAEIMALSSYNDSMSSYMGSLSDTGSPPTYKAPKLRQTGQIHHWKISVSGSLYGKWKNFKKKYKKHKIAYTVIIIIAVAVLSAAFGLVFNNRFSNHNTWNLWPSKFKIETLNEKTGNYEIYDKVSKVTYSVQNGFIVSAIVSSEEVKVTLYNEVLGFKALSAEVNFLMSDDWKINTAELTIQDGYTTVPGVANLMIKLKKVSVYVSDLTSVTFFRSLFTVLERVDIYNSTEIPSLFFDGFYSSENTHIYFYNIHTIKNAGFDESRNATLHFSSHLSVLEEYAFYKSDVLVILPDSVTIISDYAFYQAVLTVFVMPKNIEYVGSSVFKNSDLTLIKIHNGTDTSSWASDWNINNVPVEYID